MPTPFRVVDQDDPGVDLGGWDSSGRIDPAGGMDTSGPVRVGGIGLPFGDFGPEDHGFVSWVGDPFLAAGATILANGTIYLQRQLIRRDCSPTRMSVGITVAASTPTAGQCWAGVYSSAGVRLAQVATESLITGTGVIDMALATGALEEGDFVWTAFLANASTAPTMSRFSTSATIPNAGLPAVRLRSAVAGTSQTTLPATITPANLVSPGQITMWSALWE